MSEVKEELVQLEKTGKCVECKDDVVLSRAAFLGNDGNFRPEPIATPGSKVHCATCAMKIKDARVVRCPHCKGDIDPIEFRLNPATGIGVFYHGAPHCMKAINCQIVQVRAQQPRSNIVVPGRPS